MSSTPVKPCATIEAEVTPLRAGMPPKSNDFSMCSASRIQHDTPEACCAVYDSRWRAWRWSNLHSAPAAAAAPNIGPKLCVEWPSSRNS